MNLINKLEDAIFQCGRPCSHYIPHMCSRSRSLPQDQERERTILFSAVDTLFMTNNLGVILACMSDISSSCAHLLRYGTRKMSAIERKNSRKDGVDNG